MGREKERGEEERKGEEGEMKREKEGRETWTEGERKCKSPHLLTHPD